jgi:hypothetical protein
MYLQLRCKRSRHTAVGYSAQGQWHGQKYHLLASSTLVLAVDRLLERECSGSRLFWPPRAFYMDFKMQHQWSYREGVGSPSIAIHLFKLTASASSTLPRSMLVQVRCMHVSSPWTVCATAHSSVVLSNVEPPAPQVHVTKVGDSTCILPIRSYRFERPYPPQPSREGEGDQFKSRRSRRSIQISEQERSDMDRMSREKRR